MSVTDVRNWDDYYYGFCQFFKYIDSDLTDPNRFPKDKRDNNGFWVPFKVYAAYGYFICPVDPNCSWESKDVQVDVLFRYNFKEMRGELKIDREYRQKCCVHGGHLVQPLLGEMGGAKWVMQKTMHYIRRRFYDEPDSRSRNASQGSLNSTGSSVSSSTSGNASSSSGSSSSQTLSNSSGRNKKSNKLNSTGSSASSSSSGNASSSSGSSSSQTLSNSSGRNKRSNNLNSTGSSVSSNSNSSGNASSSSGSSSSQTLSNSIGRNKRSNKLPLYKPIPDHYPQFCESCMLGRCIFPPRYYIPDIQYRLDGAQLNNRRNMDFINWCLLDFNSEPYYVV